MLLKVGIQAKPSKLPFRSTCLSWVPRSLLGGLACMLMGIYSAQHSFLLDLEALNLEASLCSWG